MVQNGQQINQPFWEVVNSFGGYPFPEENLYIGTVSAGDDFLSSVDSNYNNDGYDSFFVEDASTSGYYSCDLHTTKNTVTDDCPLNTGGYAQGNPNFNSDSAGGECIVERMVDQNDFYARLSELNPPQHYVELYNCYINYTAVGNQPYFQLNIEQDYSGGYLLAIAESFSDPTLANYPVDWIAGT